MKKEKKNKVYCKNCEWLEIIHGDLQYGIMPEYRCKALISKTRDWFGEYKQFQDPAIINKNNDCPHFKPTLIFRLKQWLKENLPRRRSRSQ